MSLIQATNLTFAYDGSYDNIFEESSFHIDTDWKTGLTGRNGRGKTTLLKLLMGQHSFSGTITSSVQFDYFPKQVENMDLFTIDVILDTEHEYWEIARELSLLGVDEDVLYRPFSTLSNGERTKVQLAGMFLESGRFLLIDEPTNHLDLPTRKLVSDYLAKKKGFLLVSHDRAFLDNCVDHILAINKASIEVCSGNFSVWMQNKENRDNFEQNQNARLKKEIKHLNEAAKRTANWSEKSERAKIGFDPTKTEKSMGVRPYLGEKSRKMMAQSKSIERRNTRLADQKSQLLHDIESAPSLKLSQEKFHSKQLVLMRNIGISYGERQVCEGLDFSVEQGDRIALQGANGSGKSSILKLIMGMDIPFCGEFKKASGLKISYLPQDTDFLSGNLSDFAAENDIDESLFKAILRKLDFSRVQFDKNIESFSAGQKKKVLIAKSLCEKANLLIWDEPLNYIDIFSRMQIEELIRTYTPTMVFVEHDSAFTEEIATKIIRL